MSRLLLLACVIALVSATLIPDAQMNRIVTKARRTFEKLQRGGFDLQSKEFQTQAAPTTCQLTKVLGDPSFGEFFDCPNPFDQFNYPVCTYNTTFQTWCNTKIPTHNNHACAKSYQNFFNVAVKYGCLNYFLGPCTTSAECSVTSVCHLGFCEDICTNTTIDCDQCSYEYCGPSSSDPNKTTCINPTITSAADNAAQRNGAITGFRKLSFCTADPTLGMCFDLQRTLPQGNVTCTDFAATGCCGPFFGRLYDDCFDASDPVRQGIDAIVQMCNTTANAGMLCPFETLFPCSVNGAAQIGASLMFVLASIVAAFTAMF
jgi:hypothetical protein